MSEDLQGLLTVQEAITLIDAATVRSRTCHVRLEDAHGLRLAQDIFADRDYPPFDKSLMDGYAVRAADIQTVPVDLRVIGEIAAGLHPACAVEKGEACAIMTGAPLPDGADTIVPIEDTQGRVRILRSIEKGKFITRRGGDCAARQIVLTKGTELESAQLAVAASVGASQVNVHAKPQAAVLSTGDELVPIDSPPGPAQIRNSNNIMLVSLLRRLGCDVTDLGTAPDVPEKIRAAIEYGLNNFDALFVTGGMSMGQYDFVPRILLELGVDLKITKLKIKPGKPFVFGQFKDKFVFGLPGNPLSGFVCTLRLCSRLLTRMSGGAVVEKWVTADLESPLDANGLREFYQPAVFNGQSVKPLKWKGSADIYTLAAANALIVREENAPPLPAGATVRLLEIPS